MKAGDIMTTTVVSVRADDTVRDAAKLMARHHVSALPVVDAAGKLVGLVSEGDLLRREEIGTEKRRSWWLELLAGPEAGAKDYLKEFGRHVRDVMSPTVVTVDESAPLAQIAELLESRHIKRVPVVRAQKVVGIVSRANLIQALASLPQLVVPDMRPDDARLREQVLSELHKQRWTSLGALNVVVHNGVVNLWGTVFTTSERKALKALVERVPGVRGVQDHLIFYAPPAILV